MARTKDSPSYITTSISKLLELGIGHNQPINIRRLDVLEFAAKNLEKLLATERPKEIDNEEKVEEFRFD